MSNIVIEQVNKTIKVERVTRNVTVRKPTRNIEINLVGRRGPQGIQGEQGEQGEVGPQGDDKNFVQPFTNSAEVTVTHSLSKYPAITVKDSTGDEVLGEVEHVSINQAVIRFSASFTGQVVCN